MRAHKKYDGSAGLLNLLFIFLIKVIDFKSGDKDDDPDGTIKPTGRGELVLMEFVSEVVDSGFRWTSITSGVYKAKPISLEV